MHVCEPEIASLELVRQPRMIYTKAMQQRRVEIMHVHGIARDVIAEVVRLSMRVAPADATAREPQGEAARMMVAPVVIRGQPPLAVNGATEFSTPDDERVF